MRPYHADIGSVSTGTMREEDLIPRFLEELQDQLNTRSLHNAPLYDNAEEQQAAVREYERVTEVMADIESRLYDDDGDVREGYFESGEASLDLWETLSTELEQFSPPYCYFGSHPGDGCDYGYWPGEGLEWDFEGLRVDDTGDVPDEYVGEVLHVNERGNTTLYVADAGSLDEVWSIV